MESFYAEDFEAIVLAESGPPDACSSETRKGGRVVSLTSAAFKTVGSLHNMDRDNATATDCDICMNPMECAYAFWPCDPAGFRSVCCTGVAVSWPRHRLKSEFHIGEDGEIYVVIRC